MWPSATDLSGGVPIASRNRHRLSGALATAAGEDSQCEIPRPRAAVPISVRHRWCGRRRLQSHRPHVPSLQPSSLGALPRPQPAELLALGEHAPTAPSPEEPADDRRGGPNEE